MRMTPFVLLPALSLLFLVSFTGFSKEQIRGSAFESMRHISNQENAQNPNYDAESVGDYGRYRAQRDEHLRGQEKRGE